MQISRIVAELPGVDEAAVMMGTPANQGILKDSGLLAAEGETAGGGDLLLAIRADDETSATAAMSKIDVLLDQPTGARQEATIFNPRTLRSAVRHNPNANLALISVPGDFAAAEARKALRADLHVMIFSDNVSLDDELALKQEARERNLLVMGPDCGTAIISGVPLAFANQVPPGDIGIVGASGTGMQEISCLIARAGSGISHAIGVGGRDLGDTVGGISTLTALEWMESDPSTRHIVLVSKPPSVNVATSICAHLERSSKSFTVCFLGAKDPGLPDNAVFASTLKAAAQHASGSRNEVFDFDKASMARPVTAERRWIRGLFSGGSLAAEAQVIILASGMGVTSNTPVPGALALTDRCDGHVLIDLGDDQYTRGRPHPMIDPEVRDTPLREALSDPLVGVVLLDMVIGYGANDDPATQLVRTLDDHDGDSPVVVASVTGTDGDPQGLERQVAILSSSDVLVAPSNADATELALACLSAGH
jgi:FdrA protein